jgi:hypothetical protein
MFNTSSLPCVRHVPALQSALFWTNIRWWVQTNLFRNG